MYISQQKMVNVPLHVEILLTPIHGLAAHRAGTARGSLIKTLGRSFHPNCVTNWSSVTSYTNDHVLARHCTSVLHQPNNLLKIYRTSRECCDESLPHSSSCLQESNDSHAPFPWPIHFPGTPEHRPFAPPIAKNTWGTDASHKVHWFPDLINKLNCVSGSNYENWMQSEGFKSHYLFDNATLCCETW